jgi:hypothetical protein
MTTAAIADDLHTNPLTGLLGYGQSVWLDFIRRSLITSGDWRAWSKKTGCVV